MTAAKVVPNFGEIETEIRSTIERLDGMRGRLALEALSDPEVRVELLNVESELGAARGELAHLDLARVEVARREIDQQKKTRKKQQEQALTQARRLQAERETAVRAIDAACALLAEAASEYSRCCTGQLNALTQAGVRADIRGGARLLPIRIEGALRFALRERRAEGTIDLAPCPVRHVRPLGDTDPRVVEPLTDAA